MGFCPFLSLKIDTITRSSSSVNWTVYRSTGGDAGDPPTWNPSSMSPEHAVTVINSISPDSNDVVNYKMGSGELGTFDLAGFFVCPTSVVCQLWDSINERCGLKSTDFISNTVTNESQSVVNLIKNIIGDYSDRDGGRSLVTWLQDLVGRSTERDGDRSLATWLQDLVGRSTERDGESNNMSLYSWAKDAIGRISELDLTQIHSIGSLLKTKTHIHNKHYHNSDPEHKHHDGIGMMAGMILIAEFINDQDLDHGKGPAGSIFGRHFMISRATAPPGILSIYEHPRWADPPVEIAWQTYLTWGEEE